MTPPPPPPVATTEPVRVAPRTPARAVSQARPRRSVSLRHVLIALWVLAAGAALGYGWRYYRLPLAERPFSPLHEQLAPSGFIGHSLGIAGSLMMIVGVSMYTVRKRVAVLRSVGRLSGWLQVHIFLCTLGPFLVLLHTSFRFGGIVSIAFWSMSAVVLSGLFGRYVYVRIPKSIHGQFRSLESIERERTQLVQTICADAAVEAYVVERVIGATQARKPSGPLRAIVSAIRFDLSKRARVAKLQRAMAMWNVPAQVRGRLQDLLEKQAQTEQQILLLQPFQRLFRYWHIFHLPLAIVMFLILIVHVVVVAMFGYAWPH